MPTIQDRLAVFLTTENISVQKFERQCNMGVGAASKLTAKSYATTYAKIERAFPQLNIRWLKTGEGDMFNSEFANRFERPVGEYRENEVPAAYMTYLVPMSAMGGSLVGFEECGVGREDCERVISPVADADWAVTVYGDSMEPEYPSGSRVYVKRINPEDFIAWGNVYVLDTTNGLIVKMVVKSEKIDCVKCVSLNPSGRYDPFDVPKKTIRAMYRVLMCVSLK